MNAVRKQIFVWRGVEFARQFTSSVLHWYRKRH